MDSLVSYTLPIRGLGDGQHQFDFTVDKAFFSAFDDSPLSEATVDMQVQLDKRPTILVFDFSFTGKVKTNCDRCLVDIDLPISGENRLLVKYSETEEAIDEDVVYISRETSKWNIAQYIYEYILLSMPLIKTYDCEADEPIPCDEAMLDHLEIEEPEEDSSANPTWDALKDWNNPTE